MAGELEDYTIDPVEAAESEETSMALLVCRSEVAALLGDQQFEMYTEYKGKRHEDNFD